MKMHNRRTMWLLLGLTAWLSISSIAFADSLSDLKQRFKQRYPQLIEAKHAGKIGETWQGWVEAVKPPLDDTLAALVKAENADRAELYAIIANKEGTTAAHVGERNAIRNFERAQSGDYLKGQDGAWRQKK